jgi:hypothetical protein
VRKISALCATYGEIEDGLNGDFLSKSSLFFFPSSSILGRDGNGIYEQN